MVRSSPTLTWCTWSNFSPSQPPYASPFAPCSSPAGLLLWKPRPRYLPHPPSHASVTTVLNL
ncbi:hypothetical protein DPMN_042178 [Dreissena polymorpha]|uniref:Uncharacterized protein n=1 Tax=Dreissena polymorpha TaxID=45954 RepID=A0A9D4CY45_DREPO|nr:hypothetical protein DPMN_042178 [Dreissena polymorpha]